MLKFGHRTAANRVGGAFKKLVTLWVTYGEYQPVSLKVRRGNVDKLKNAVKRKLPGLSEMKNAEIMLLKHQDTVALKPGMIIDKSFKNTDNNPLQVSIIGKPLRWST